MKNSAKITLPIHSGQYDQILSALDGIHPLYTPKASNTPVRLLIKCAKMGAHSDPVHTNKYPRNIPITHRGAKGKIPILEMLKRRDKVYTQIVKNCSMSELMPIIKGKADKGAVIYTDGFKTYDGLADYGYKKHYRGNHGENEFATGHKHINGIENFWGLCKVRLAKFRGVHKHNFYLHIKECEFRYNYRNQNIYLIRSCHK